MPRTWIPTLYRTHDAQTGPPDATTVETLMQAVDDCNARLPQDAYNPDIWTERASYFLALNYPELAASDAYKAGLLLDDLDTRSREAKSTDLPMRLRAYGILGQALYDCHCHCEAAEFWEKVATKVPGEFAKSKAEGIRELLKRKEDAAAGLGGTPQEQKDRLRDGGVVTVHYPWIEKRQLTRSPELVDMINKELREKEEACYLKSSSLASRDDMLGLFAARDMEPSECIIVDRTATGICSIIDNGCCENCYGPISNSSVKASCCSTVYCSQECYDLAVTTYHQALCGKDFSYLFKGVRGLRNNASPMRPLLMLRFLAACVQAGAHNSPLDHPIIARLQPLANREHLGVFTFTESIITPIKILKQLGVDVFANPNFDTMILHSIWTRIANNKAGSSHPTRGFIDEITPLLPLFNHSCEPNVEYRRDGGSTTMRFYTQRSIKTGEELFISYRNVEGVKLEQRVKMLWPWFEEPCLCTRCKRERG